MNILHMKAIIAIGKILDDVEPPITYNQFKKVFNREGPFSELTLFEILREVECTGFIKIKRYFVSHDNYYNYYYPSLIWPTNKFPDLSEEQEVIGLLKAIDDKTIEDDKISYIRDLAKSNYDFYTSAKEDFYNQAKKYNSPINKDREEMYNKFIKDNEQTASAANRILEE